MNSILLGMPGSGKGTISSWMETQYKYRQISTGDLLREEKYAQTTLGKQVETIIDTGQLVSDNIIIALVKKHVELSLESYEGVVFDGFPRTIQQAESLEEIVRINKVIYIEVDEKVVEERLLKRVDESGERRDDDEIDVIKERISVFFKKTQPLIDYYGQKGLLTKINGNGSINEIREKVSKIITAL